VGLMVVVLIIGENIGAPYMVCGIQLKQFLYPTLFLMSFIITHQPNPDSHCHCKLKDFVKKMVQPKNNPNPCRRKSNYLI
jgi:hypothetical protein